MEFNIFKDQTHLTRFVKMAAYGHYFDEETKEIHSIKDVLDLDDRGLGYLLFQSIKKSSGEGLTAQIDAATGHRDSFKSFQKRCIRLALSLQECGIQPGDIIGISSYNHLNSAVVLIAGFYIGAIVATTDPTISLEDQKHLLGLVQPRILFVSNGSEEMMSKAIAAADFTCEIVSFAMDKGIRYRTFASMIENNEAEEDFEPVIAVDLSATCVILFSSGTTGLPKGICLSHLYLLNAILGLSLFKQGKLRLLSYSTLYWISAVLFQSSCLYYGVERVVCTSFNPELLWEYVVKYEVQSMFLAPVQAIKTINYLQYFNPETIPLKLLLLGGTSIARKYFQRLRELLPNCIVANGYGQTEIGLASSFSKRDENYEKLDSVGVLSVNYVGKIVDPDTEEPLDLNQRGEICLKPLYAMNGYYKQDSSSVFDADGFVKTGDLGYFDEDLCLYLTDRIKEMFKYQSWHIVPAKLEAILQSHPDVELAIVVGIPHPIDDNHAVGAVTLVSGASVTSNELEQYVEERVDDRNKLRAGVVILDAMPLTPTGKVMRRQAKVLLLNTVKLRS